MEFALVGEGQEQKAANGVRRNELVMDGGASLDHSAEEPARQAAQSSPIVLLEREHRIQKTV